MDLGWGRLTCILSTFNTLFSLDSDAAKKQFSFTIAKKVNSGSPGRFFKEFSIPLVRRECLGTQGTCYEHEDCGQGYGCDTDGFCKESHKTRHLDVLM